jgi:hypothetical protein
MSCETDQVTVMLEEEYGYRQWIWRTGMTGEELVAFWKALPSVMPYFFSPRSLPGELEQVQQDYEECYEAFMVRCAGLKEASCGWTGHIHIEQDSYLLPPDGKEVTHAGAKSFNAEEGV